MVFCSTPPLGGTEHLSLPLPIEEKVDVMISAANCKELNALHSVSSAEHEVDNKEALKAYLQTFNLIYSNITQNKIMPPPAVGIVDVPESSTNSPYISSLLKNRDDQMNLRNKIIVQNKLLIIEPDIEGKISELSKKLNFPNGGLNAFLKENLSDPNAYSYLSSKLSTTD